MEPPRTNATGFNSGALYVLYSTVTRYMQTRHLSAQQVEQVAEAGP